MPYPSLLHPEPLPLRQSTADLYLHRRHSNTILVQSLWGLWVLVCTVWTIWASLAGMQLDSKCNFTPATVLLGLLLCPWLWGIFFGGIQHSAVDSCSAASCSEMWKCCESAALNMPANLENTAVVTGLEKISFHSNPKERQRERMFKLLHSWTHLTR